MTRVPISCSAPSSKLSSATRTDPPSRKIYSFPEKVEFLSAESFTSAKGKVKS